MQTEVNGVRIDYIDEGEGPALVFVHGFPLSKECWRPQIDAFSSEYRCIAPDYLGFGLSDHPIDFRYTPAEQAQVIRAAFIA